MLQRTIYALILTLLCTSCLHQVHHTGHTLEADRLARIKENESARDDVTRYLGSPSAKSEYGEEVWYYIFSEFEQVAFLEPEITKQSVVSFTFNEDGIVSHIEHYDTDDARLIDPTREKTTTGGHSLSILEQLLGNVGRFNTK